VTLACTFTPLLVALVLHTQMANVAEWPDLTSPEGEKDSTRTQSCGVLWALRRGGDLVAVGEGDGLGDLLDVLGDGEGDVEVDVLSVGGDELPDLASDCELLGVADGLVVAVWLGEGEALGEADLEALGDADLLLLAEPLGDADALLLADSLAL
jgi:hypothetical protein